MSRETERLIDILLWEEIGSEKVPDVAERVLDRAFQRRRRSWLRVAAVAALLVLCVLAGWWVMGRRYPAPEASGSYKILGAAEIRRGAVVVTERLPASLALGGYCQVRLDPSTTLRIGGKAGSEEVFLERGGVKCEVNRGAGAFAVHSPVGSVSVTGTSFSVALLEREKGKIGVGSRKAALMAVAVTAGSVSVDYNGKTFRLSAGAQQVFGEEAGSGPNRPAPAPAPATNTARVAGQLSKIDGKTLTITDNATKDTVITCDDATKFSRDGAGPVKFEDLQVGQPVRAYYTKTDNVAVAVIIAKAPGEAPAPAPAANTTRVAGQLSKIDGKTLTITADGKDTVITCNDATKFSRDGAGPVKFEDLQVDQQVRAYYTKADNVAVAVIIAKPPAGK